MLITQCTLNNNNRNFVVSVFAEGIYIIITKKGETNMVEFACSKDETTQNHPNVTTLMLQVRMLMRASRGIAARKIII